MTNPRNTIALSLLAWLNKGTQCRHYPTEEEGFGWMNAILINVKTSKPLVEFLRTRIADRHWHVTPRGMAITLSEARRVVNELVDALDSYERWLVGERTSPKRLEVQRDKPVGTLAHSSESARVAAIKAAFDEVPFPEDRPGFIRWEVCDQARLKEQIDKQSSGSRNEERRRLLESLAVNRVRWIPIVNDGHIKSVQRLADSFPNYQEVIDALVRKLKLRKRLKQSLWLPKLLLDGAPGLGKTLFVQRLATVLGLHYRVMSFADVTGGFVLTGSHNLWSGAGPGILAAHILNTPPDKMPLLLGDELDKASGNRSHATDVSLLGALEGHSAARFRDEFLDLEIDIRPLSLILASNNRNQIRPEMLSRMTLVNIRLPTPDEMPTVVRSVDRLIRDESEGIADMFRPLSDEVVRSIAVHPPRAIRKILEDAYDWANSEAEDEASDIEVKLAHLGIKPVDDRPAPAMEPDPGHPTPDQPIDLSEIVQDMFRLLMWWPKPGPLH